jgi:hypothetical protein
MLLLTEWKPLVPAEEVPAFDAVVKRAAEFRTFRSETARLSQEVSPQAANEQGNNDLNRANRKAFQAEIDAIVDTDRAALDTIQNEVNAIESRMVLRWWLLTRLRSCHRCGNGLLHRHQAAQPADPATDRHDEAAR